MDILFKKMDYFLVATFLSRYKKIIRRAFLNQLILQLDNA